MNSKKMREINRKKTMNRKYYYEVWMPILFQLYITVY